jgi:hypothetical protein
LSRGQEYFLSVARDISRRLALEAELNQREKQLWFALNEATDGLWDWNIPAGEVFFSPQLKHAGLWPGRDAALAGDLDAQCAPRRCTTGDGPAAGSSGRPPPAL